MFAIVDDVRCGVTVGAMKLWALRCGDLYPDIGGLIAGDAKGVMAVVPEEPSGILASDLAEITADPWDYEGTFDLMPGLQLISTPGHTPGHQALLVSFTDGRNFVCAGDAAYTLQAIVEHRPTGRGTDLDQSIASLHTLTSLRAEILTAHDIDQWRHVNDAELIHSA